MIVLIAATPDFVWPRTAADEHISRQVEIGGRVISLLPFHVIGISFQNIERLGLEFGREFTKCFCRYHLVPCATPSACDVYRNQKYAEDVENSVPHIVLQAVYVQTTFTTSTSGTYFAMVFDSFGQFQDVDSGQFTMKIDPRTKD
jgi:predicted aconitase